MFAARVCVLVCMLVCVCAVAANNPRLRMQAKLLARARVEGPQNARYVHAWSPSHCLARCSKIGGTGCDGVNFHQPSGKCFLLPRCTRTLYTFTSLSYYFYSKRPQLSSDGFHYDPATGSCLKVLESKLDYATADRICARENGRLVALKSLSTNEMARELLRAARAQFAWIGLLDIGQEGNPTHSDGSRALDLNFFRPAKQHWRNSTHRNCWALQDTGLWAEMSCKNRKLFSICEVPTF